MCVCLWQNFGCPGVTLCGWQDEIKIQSLTDSFSAGSFLVIEVVLLDGMRWFDYTTPRAPRLHFRPSHNHKHNHFCGYVMKENEHREVYEIFPLRLWCCVTKRFATVARQILSCAFKNHSGISRDARCTCFTWPKSGYGSVNFGEESQDRTVGTYLKDIAGHFTFRYTSWSYQHSSEHWTPTQHNQKQIHSVQFIFYRLTVV